MDVTVNPAIPHPAIDIHVGSLQDDRPNHLFHEGVLCWCKKKYRTGNSCLPKTTSEAWGTAGLATICNNSLCPQNYPPYVVGNISEHRTPKRPQRAKQQIFFQTLNSQPILEFISNIIFQTDLYFKGSFLVSYSIYRMTNTTVIPMVVVVIFPPGNVSILVALTNVEIRPAAQAMHVLMLPPLASENP